MDMHPREVEPIGSQIKKIGDYLHCQGYALLSAQSDHHAYGKSINQRFSVSEMLSGYEGHALSKMNESGQKFLKEIFGPKLGRFEPIAKKQSLLNKRLPTMKIAGLKAQGKDQHMVGCLLNASMLTPVNDGYAFASAEAFDFLTGGWIEEWCWAIARDCKPDDYKANVTVTSLDAKKQPSSEPDNELDLVILHGNRLLIAECKTIEWGGAAAKQEIFNKLDALGTHARGLFGKSLLISAKKLDDKARRRAVNYGIQVIEQNGLRNLKTEILTWMGLDKVQPD